MAHPYPSSEPTDDEPSAWRPSAPATFADRADHLRTHLSASPLRSLGLVAVVVLAAGVAWWLLRPPPPPIESTLPLATGAAPAPDGAAGPVVPVASTTTAGPVELVVQSAGAVSSPGVYRLAPGARVDDLVAASGGLVADADVDRVNLAAPVGDGERVWFPRKGDEEPPVVVAGGGGGSAPSPAGEPGPDAPPAVVNLNTATAAELDTLPGVGPSTASAILAHREEHGPFAAVDDLLDVRGIGDAKLEQIRPLATV